jgi:hypothetical protein
MNSILFNTAGSIALAINYEIQGAYSDKFLTKEADKTVRINAEFFVRVGDAIIVVGDDTDLTIADLDAGADFSASATYYIYACHPLSGSAPVFKISLNATYPAGWAANTSRKLGGFTTDASGNIDEATLWDLRTTDVTHTGVTNSMVPANEISADKVGGVFEVDFGGRPVRCGQLIAGQTIYGVRWNTSNDTYQRVVVIEGALVALDPGYYPVHEQMKRCVLNNAREVQYYLHSSDSTKKADGSASNLDGTDGQVQVQVPKFHYAIYTDGDYKVSLVSLGEFSVAKTDETVVTSRVHEWFMEGGTEADYKYVGAFEGVLYDDSAGSYVDGTGASLYASGDKIASVAGFKPMTYISRNEYRTAAADGVFHQKGYYGGEAVILLYLTEYANWNSQAMLPGYTEGGAFDYDTKVCKTGITASLGNASGSINWEDADTDLRCSYDQTGKVVANSFRGIENFYGHIWKWVDGINIQYIGDPLTDADVHVCNNPANFGDDTTINYTDLGIDLPLSSGYQRDLHDGILLPSSASGGSSDTFITDYFYASSAAGWRALRSGGDLNYGADAGCAYRYANNAASYRYSTIGGRSAA